MKRGLNHISTASQPQLLNTDKQPPQPPQSGVKYLLAARADAAPQLLPRAAPALAAALGDPEDAVQAAAADALAPVAGLLLALDRGVGGFSSCLFMPLGGSLIDRTGPYQDAVHP